MKNMEERRVGGGEDGTQEKRRRRRRKKKNKERIQADTEKEIEGVESWEHKQVCCKQKHTHRALNMAYLHRLVVLSLALSVPPHHIMRREKCEMAI